MYLLYKFTHTYVKCSYIIILIHETCILYAIKSLSVLFEGKLTDCIASYYNDLKIKCLVQYCSFFQIAVN